MKVVFTIGAVVIASGFAACGGKAHHNAASVGTSHANGAAAPTAPVPTVPASTVPASTVPASTVPAPTVPAPTVPTDSVSQVPTGEFELKIHVLRNAGGAAGNSGGERGWGGVKTPGLPYFAVQQGYLPAVASDGSALALLFNETSGGADVPISTLVVIDKHGKVQSVSLSGHQLDSAMPAQGSLNNAAAALQKRRDEAANVASKRAATLLATHKWRAAVQTTAIHRDELAPGLASAFGAEYKAYQGPEDRDTAATFLQVADTLLAFEPNNQSFTRMSIVDNQPAKRAPQKTPSHGRDEVTKAKCGVMYAIDRAYWHETFPYAFVLASSQAGDSCVENPDPMGRGTLLKL